MQAAVYNVYLLVYDVRHIFEKGARMATKSCNIRIDEGVKARMDEVAESLGMTTSTAVNVFARQFIARRGFPFEVRMPVPTEEEFAAEMDRRYEEILAGHYVEHDLVEV